MNTKHLADCLDPQVAFECPKKLAIAGFSLSSRSIKPGEVFVAVPGAQVDGRGYIEKAVAAGAVAVLYESHGAEPFLRDLSVCVPLVGVADLSHQLGMIARRFYSASVDAQSVVAVTGTNGKTTVSQLVAQAVTRMSHQALSAGVIGTLGAGLVGQLHSALNTTPDVITVQRLLAEFASRGARLVALEASSHGLEQGRLNGVPVTSVVWTNISRDHLDYHGTMDAYIDAKAKILAFESLKTAWFNLDDTVCAQLAGRAHPYRFVTKRYSASGSSKADLAVVNSKVSRLGIEMTISCGESRRTLSSPLIGAFNIDNLLAAYCALLGEGFGPEQVIDGLSQVSPVAGRMETVLAPGGVVFVIDYAHTPDALDKAMASIRSHVKNRLIVVFGCGGDRDKGKRPEMAKVVELHCDIAVVTSDNPRTEVPETIIEDIVGGFDSMTPVVRLDRRDAIETAWQMSTEGDFILIAGKGHEPYQEINGERFPFSDREVAQSIIAHSAQDGSCRN